LQAEVQVSTVAGHGVATLTQAAENLPREIHQRQAKHHQDRGHFRAADDAERAEKKAEQRCAAAKKNFRRIEIEQQIA